VTLRPDGDADLPAALIDDFQTPHCETCGGVLMPDVVFFGGTVPAERVQTCYRMIDEAEGLVVIGSSLSVYSGFRFCRYAIQQDKPLIILNVGQTRADELCLHKFDDDPFSTLSQYVAQLDSQTPERQHV
jgi:NAD-dependent SIR2 family protein deacetylase